MSLTGVLAVGASMAVVGMTSTAAQAASYNIALNKTATGSTSCNANETPAKAVDGSVAGTTNKWCSTATTKYLEVDLGSSQTIHQFVVKHAGAGGESSSLNTKNFNISVRNTTSESWTQVVTATNNSTNTSTHNVTPVLARYAKLDVIDGEQAGINGPARIYEFEAYKDLGTNVALSQTATGSTSCNGNQTPAKAVDGSVATTNNKWCSTATTKYLEVDLGSVKQIQQFVVKHAGAGGESANYNTKDFAISTRVSTSDSWTQEVSVTGNSANTTTHDISSTFGRYIRLDVTDGTQAGQDHHARVYEIEAYGFANLALSTSATEAFTGCQGSTPGNAVDGNLTTKWCANGSYLVHVGNRDVWMWRTPELTVDLGATKTITGIRVYHAGSNGESNTFNTKEFTVSGAAGAYDSGIINENVTSAAAGLSGRYITLSVTSPEQTWHVGSSARIYEFEIFGY